MRPLLGVLWILGMAGQESPDPAGPWRHPPALGRPAGAVVEVRTEAQLQAAVGNLKSGATVLIAPGVYELTRTLHIRGGLKNAALRGASGKRGDVVLKGRGMRNKDYGSVPHGIMVSDAADVLLADLSVGDVWFHPVTLQGTEGCKRVHICNVRLFDAGEQFLKANPDGKGGGVNGCVVEYCVFEYTTTARHNYTQGMSVHTCADWIVRNNLFRNIRGPKGDPDVGGCIDFWNGSKNAVVEGNVIVNCRMGIRFGILHRWKEKGFHEHQGGVIRNNVIWRQPGAVESPDMGIGVWDSPGTKVLHNTVILNGTYPNGSIEYRWADGVVIAGNLADAKIWRREEAAGEEADNVVDAGPGLFVNAAAGDFHLAKSAVAKVRRRPDCPLDWDGSKRADVTDPGADECPEKR